jgi:Leucine-rich repeat (LRR) protein
MGIRKVFLYLLALPESIGNLEKLKGLYLDDNPLARGECEKVKKNLPNTHVIC